jgi:uncharacterized lipoprotein YehR (DUF1307 family)
MEVFMKKFMFGILVAVVCCAALTGCDDSGQKIGGGGLMQSFDKATGRYN